MSADADNYNLQNVECYCEISSRSPRFAKRATMNLSDMAVFLSPAISARLWFDSRLRHNAFRKPTFRSFWLPYHFMVASQWDGNPAFTMHAIRVLYCTCFQSSDKAYTVLLPGICRGGMNEATVPKIQGSGSSTEWNYKKCIYQNLVT